MESLREKRGSGVLLHKPQLTLANAYYGPSAESDQFIRCSTFHRQPGGMKFNARSWRNTGGWIHLAGQSNLNSYTRVHGQSIQATAMHADGIFQQQDLSDE